jgi:hypothetical protein
MSSFVSGWRKMTHDEALDRCVQLEKQVEQLEKRGFNMTKVCCPLVTCISSKDGICQRESVIFTYFSESEMTEDPEIIKLIKDRVGCFASMQCPLFKMDYDKAKKVLE